MSVTRAAPECIKYYIKFCLQAWGAANYPHHKDDHVGEGVVRNQAFQCRVQSQTMGLLLKYRIQVTSQSHSCSINSLRSSDSIYGAPPQKMQFQEKMDENCFVAAKCQWKKKDNGKEIRQERWKGNPTVEAQEGTVFAQGVKSPL